MTNIGQYATQTAVGSTLNAGIGAIFGLPLAAMQNRYTRENTEEAAKLNYMYGEEAAENAAKREISLYERLYSPQAQLKYLTEAGLSPGLMYSNGGGTGGSSAFYPMGQGAGGQQGKPFDISSVLQMANLAANTAKMQAETRLTNAEASNEENGKREQLEANVKYILSQTKNTDAQTENLELEKNWLEARDLIKTKYWTNICNEIEHRVNKLIEETNKLMQEVQFNADGYLEALLKETKNHATLLWEEAQTQKTIQTLNKAQANSLWYNIIYKAYEVATDIIHVQNEATYWENTIKVMCERNNIEIAKTAIEGFGTLAKSITDIMANMYTRGGAKALETMFESSNIPHMQTSGMYGGKD